MSCRSSVSPASESSQTDLEKLCEIGAALSEEKDLERLLQKILKYSREILGADAGSIFLAEGENLERPKNLRFKHAQNDSVALELTEFVIPINSESLVGYVAEHRLPVRIDDVYALSDDRPFRFYADVDRKSGYRSKSLVSVAMVDHQDHLIGVVQLWNKKRKVDSEVVSFSEADQRLLSSLSSQAAISIENTRLYHDIEKLFEGFIRASVGAIEARDPTTHGHSGRVAVLTTKLATLVDRSDEGSFRHIRFTEDQMREIRYASLLHDFGKIGVREAILVKPQKLYASEVEVMEARFAACLLELELGFERRRVAHLLKGGREGDDVWKAITTQEKEATEQVRSQLKLVHKCNQPNILTSSVRDDLNSLSNLVFRNFEGVQQGVLTEEQILRLAIPKGSLSAEERLAIESHVTHTYEFLRQIPWTRNLRNTPEIAFAHHEKLDGTGYPRQVNAAEIPIQSKLMAVSDVYDALAARDRPYKKALPPSKALEILEMESAQGKMDRDLVRLFIEAKVYEATPALSLSP